MLSAIGAAGKRQFYKRIVASELKRQLAVVNGKLDNLQAQNEALRAELARLKQENAPELSQELKDEPVFFASFIKFLVLLPYMIKPELQAGPYFINCNMISDILQVYLTNFLLFSPFFIIAEGFSIKILSAYSCPILLATFLYASPVRQILYRLSWQSEPTK